MWPRGRAWGPWAVGPGEAPGAESGARVQPAVRTAASGWRPAVRRSGRPTAHDAKPFLTARSSNEGGSECLRPCPPAAAEGPVEMQVHGPQPCGPDEAAGTWAWCQSSFGLVGPSWTRQGHGHPGGWSSLRAGRGRGQCGCWATEDKICSQGPSTKGHTWLPGSPHISTICCLNEQALGLSCQLCAWTAQPSHLAEGGAALALSGRCHCF